MENINWYSVIGLILDIIGVILIFYNGLYPKIRHGAEWSNEEMLAWMKENKKDDLIKKNRLAKFLAYAGLWLIIIGFFCQLLGVFFSKNITNGCKRTCAYENQKQSCPKVNTIHL